VEGGDDSAFGRLLRQHRLASNLSQEALAEKARMSAVGVGALERGTRRAPYRDTVILLADALALAGSERERFVAAAQRKRSRPRADKRATPAARPPALPVRLTSFVGREREVGEIAALLREEPLVTVTGIGGIGKTSAVLRVAAVTADEWNGQVCFVPLSALQDGALVPSALAAALGVRMPAQGDPVYALCEALRERRLLLILDNCEHLVADAAAVASAVLRACRDVKILASSREPLGIAGEFAYRLSVLDLADSVALFAERAAAHDAHFTLDEQNASVVAETCRRLEGIPLAIELAAARVRMLGPVELLQRLDERLRVLTGGPRDAPSHQHTLRATLDWSYALLSDTERVVLRRTGVFVGGFTLKALSAVLDGLDVDEAAALDALQSLIDKSLVNADVSASPPRYTLLESTRAYALELLAAGDEREPCANVHLLHYVREFERAEAVLEETLSDDAIVALVPEFENVRAALAWSLAGGNVAGGLALAIASGRLWFVLGLMHERIAQIETCIAACGEDRLVERCRLRTSLAYIAGDSLRATRAVEAAREALADARRCDDPYLLHQALVAYAFVAARRRDLDGAAAAFDEAQALSGFRQTPRQRMRAMSTRGLIASHRNDLDDAALAHEESFTLATALGNAHWRMIGMLNLAEIEHQRGRTRRAIELSREVAPEAAKRLSRNAYVHLMNNLAGYSAAVDELPAARAAVRESLARLKEADPKSGLVSIALEHLALVLALEGDVERAARILGYCEAAYAEAGYVREFTERTSNDRLTRILDERLASLDAARLRETGAAFTLERAIEEATR
jgi:predicted ATPase